MEIHHTCIKPITPNNDQTGVYNITAKLIVKCGETKVMLKASDDTIQAITECTLASSQIITRNLLFSQLFTGFYNIFHVITKVLRE